MKSATEKVTEHTPDHSHCDDRRHEPGPVSTYLVIPYFNGDRGRPAVERPLGTGTVWWLCPSIVVNGQPGKNAFQRGVPTSVTVDVANWGAGTGAAPVQVRVWWSEPSTGFTSRTLLGQSVVIVPTGGGVYRCPPIVGVIPKTASAHVCLLAHVSSPLDTTLPGRPIDPVNDRHWSQLNIVEITTTVGLQFQFMIWAGNPLTRPTTFTIAAQPVSRDTLPTLDRIRRAETMRCDRASIRLLDRQRGDDQSARHGERAARRDVTIEPGQRRAIHVIGELPAETEPGMSVAFEVVQSATGEKDDQARVYGAVGLIITARSHG